MPRGDVKLWAECRHKLLCEAARASRRQAHPTSRAGPTSDDFASRRPNRSTTHTHTNCYGRHNIMSFTRSSQRLVTRLPPTLAQSTTFRSAQHLQQIRPISSTPVRSGGHGPTYDAPTGWLFGVKPGEKYQNEGWENLWFYGFFGALAACTIGYIYKPDTR